MTNGGKDPSGSTEKSPINTCEHALSFLVGRGDSCCGQKGRKSVGGGGVNFNGRKVGGAVNEPQAASWRSGKTNRHLKVDLIKVDKGCKNSGERREIFHGRKKRGQRVKNKTHHFRSTRAHNNRREGKLLNTPVGRAEEIGSLRITT